MEPEAGLRRSRSLAFAAFLALGTALLVPWWVVSWDDGQTVSREAVRPFSDHRPLATLAGPWVSGLLSVAALGLLFVRLAAGSWRHEPPAWRRDLAIALGLAVAALVGALAWPQDVPAFWGGRTYTLEGGSGPSVTETALPGIGWWLGWLAAGLLFTAWLLTRPAKAPTTPK